MYSVEIDTITQIDSAAIQLIAELNAAIPEFSQAYTATEIEQRLTNKQSLLLIVKVEGEIAGFKLGYALTETKFYSWLGAILPDFRNLGLASQLLRQQELWVQSNYFQTIEVKTRNCFPSMLNMLIRHQYQITAMNQNQHDTLQHELFLQKAV